MHCSNPPSQSQRSQLISLVPRMPPRVAACQQDVLAPPLPLISEAALLIRGADHQAMVQLVEMESERSAALQQNTPEQLEREWGLRVAEEELAAGKAVPEVGCSV